MSAVQWESTELRQVFAEIAELGNARFAEAVERSGIADAFRDTLDRLRVPPLDLAWLHLESLPLAETGYTGRRHFCACGRTLCCDLEEIDG